MFFSGVGSLSFLFNFLLSFALINVLIVSNAAFPPAGALRPSMPQPSSESAVWPISLTARISTAGGQGLSRMAIAAAAT